MKKYLNSLDELSRRRFVERSAKSLLGVSLLPAIGTARAQSQKAGGGKGKSLIFLYMSGGMSHLDTFDPKTNAEVKGPTTPLKTNVPGISISNHLPKLAKQMDKMAIIRSMNSVTGVHGNGSYVARTGYRPRATIVHPCLGAYGQYLEGRRNANLPDSVVIGTGGGHPGAGFMGAKFKPVPINDPESGLQNSRARTSESKFDERLTISNSFDSAFRERFDHLKVRDYTELYEETVSLMRSEDLEAFDISKEDSKTRANYGEDRFAKGCLLARRLVEHGVRYVEVEAGGWDMHYYIGEGIAGRGAMLDQAVSALLKDLDSKGLLETTVVAIGTEFGRTPRINANDGRDHHPRVFSTMLAGGGITGGAVWGASDDKGYAVAKDQVTIQDFVATLGYGLGLDTEKTIFSPSGRPFTIGDKGKPVTQIFG
jgi:hypothetical protein